jgi:hypothetical protein
MRKMEMANKSRSNGFGKPAAAPAEVPGSSKKGKEEPASKPTGKVTKMSTMSIPKVGKDAGSINAS